ncbi:hypothetical protein EDD16DRAFT_540627 [Pisolithus croceorrhizus]|nr:hypothetical protein EDD16DRAFT_540627 [Pisolithus croceorrhizus]KAI6100348.1 hypothetical protein F5141DRAFT_332236 [Pisolithus sp. B1]
MVGNRRIVQEDDEEENTRRTILKMLLLQQIQVVGAVLAACQIVIATIQDTTSQESEEESSFCYSSAVTADQSWKDGEPAPPIGDTYNVRMERVHLWRDTVMKDASSSRSLSLKRKLNSCHNADDSSSHCPSKPSKRPRTASKSSRYMCSACDMPFPSQPKLRQHARMPRAHEACRAAIDYHFE